MISELGQASHQGNLTHTLSKANQTEKYIIAHMGKDEFGFMARVNMFRGVAYILKGQDLQRLAKEAES
jgi:tetratricopeptide (TPR) repeat protein